MATADRLMDADTFLARPESIWPREELIDGRIVVSEPTLGHQDVCGRIFVRLTLWIEHGEGFGHVALPLDMRISDDTVLVPDVLWYADPARTDRHAPAQLEPPDLVVEVRSPSTWRRDVGVKSERYAGWGVRELWLVDAEARRVTVRRRARDGAAGFDVELDAGDELTSPLLPGFALALADLFAERHQK